MLIFGLIFIICLIISCVITKGDKMWIFLSSFIILLFLADIYFPIDKKIQSHTDYKYDIVYNLQQTPDGKWYDEKDEYYAFITENKIIIVPKVKVCQYQSDKNILVESHNVRNGSKYWWIYSFDWTLSNSKDRITEYKLSIIG